MQIEANMFLIKHKFWVYQVYLLRLFGLLALGVQGMDMVGLWVINKELGLAIS